MSNNGMNWLLGTATLVAVVAIGVGVYVLNTGSSPQEQAAKDAPLVTKVKGSGAQSGRSAASDAEDKAAADEQDMQVASIDPQSSPDEDGVAPGVEVTPTIKPSFDVMRVEPSGDAVVAGRSEAGAIVAVISNGEVLGKGVANKNGEFAIVLEKPLKPGDHDVSLEATREAADGKSEKTVSDQRIAVSIPKDASEEVLVVLNDPKGPSTVLQVPEAQPSETETASVQKTEESNIVVGAVSSSQATSQTGNASATQQTLPQSSLRVQAVESQEGKVYVAGEGEPGSKVRVYVGDELVGETQTDKNGRWLVQGNQQIAVGDVNVRADEVKGSEGEVVARAQVTFAKADDQVILRPLQAVATGTASGGAGATIEAGVGQLPNVIIRKGDNLWTISRRLYGEGIRYTTIYQANDRQIRDPDLIYPGQVFVLPESDVNWKTQTN
ncbi:Ig-like domain-containing protein [Pseudovibrio exalbescens]|uniref:Ig-like domain-containing protein n=1 Tax=Pseudovibrio exalbescens TaxID=197461 RepID=UPI000C9A7E3D|nr:Ig-like domain-containing protein [Pseudovibrio exalbescens]